MRRLKFAIYDNRSFVALKICNWRISLTFSFKGLPEILEVLHSPSFVHSYLRLLLDLCSMGCCLLLASFLLILPQLISCLDLILKIVRLFLELYESLLFLNIHNRFTLSDMTCSCPLLFYFLQLQLVIIAIVFYFGTSNLHCRRTI